MTFNCTLCDQSVSQSLATWVINGYQVYYVELLDSPLYEFNPFDNSLGVNNVSRSICGFSFQCILNRQASNIGYLTVIDGETKFNTTGSELETTTPTQNQLKTVYATYGKKMLAKIPMHNNMPQLYSIVSCPII